jgi:tRNA(Arg) A34 adenosine deaminase TadA
VTAEEAKDLMALIVKETPGKAIAFMEIANGGTSTIECVTYQRRDAEPYTHITLLYQAILAKFSRAKAKQNPLYTSVPATEMCQGMKNVIGGKGLVHTTGGDSAAASLDLILMLEFNDPTQYIGIDALSKFKLRKAIASPDLDLAKESKQPDHTGYHTVHRVYMMLAYALLTKRSTLEVGEGHNIGVLVVSKTGQILSWGINTNSVNTTRHGEVNAIQSYFKYTADAKALPKGARLYTTLKPCKMCAGMILETAAEKDIMVYWGQDDEGDPAKNTALDRYQKTKHVVVQRLLSKNEPIGLPKPIRLYDSTGKQAESMASQLTAGQGATPVTQYLESTTAVGLMGSAVATLGRKMTRNQVTTTAATKGKTVNPNVQKALSHIRTFVTDQGIPGVLS